MSKRVWVVAVVMLLVMMMLSSNRPGVDARIFGIPGTIIGHTLLQVGPGREPGVITTLLPSTSVQVLCKVERSDAMVGDDPWWLRVHVWASGLEGFVADFWVLCRHHSGPCRVPFCPV